MAGRAAAGKEIEHDVAGAGGLLQQVLDQRQGLGMLECLVTKEMLDFFGGNPAACATYNRKFIFAIRRQTRNIFVHACNPAAQRSKAILFRLCAPVFLSRWPAGGNRLANPEIQIGQEATDLTQDQYTIVMFLRAQLVIEGPDKLGLVLVSDIAAAITALTKPAA